MMDLHKAKVNMNANGRIMYCIVAVMLLSIIIQNVRNRLNIVATYRIKFVNMKKKPMLMNSLPVSSRYMLIRLLAISAKLL